MLSVVTLIFKKKIMWERNAIIVKENKRFFGGSWYPVGNVDKS